MNKRYTFFALLSLSLLLAVTTVSAQTNSTQASLIPSISEDYLEKLINTAKTNYPRVKANYNRINLAKSNISKAKVSWFDALTFSYVYQPNQNSLNLANVSYSYFNGLQLGVFFNLGTLLQKPYNVKVAREELNVATNEQQEYLLTLTLDVKRKYYTYVERMMSLKGLNQSALDGQNSMTIIRHKYEKGEETFENYSRAQLTAAQENELKLQGEANLLIAKAELEALLGDKLENIK